MMKSLLASAVMVLGVMGSAAGVAAQNQGEVGKMLRVEWEPGSEAFGRPKIVGYVYNDSRYRIGSVRLRVESLDGEKRVVRETLAWTYFDVPAAGRAYFFVARPQGGTDFRLSVESFVLISIERRGETP